MKNCFGQQKIRRLIFISNRWGIPEDVLKKIRERDNLCVYCRKKIIYPYNRNNHKNSATIEHLNHNGPFYWKAGLQTDDIVICCGECNSSRGKKKLLDWFKTSYCLKKNINENTVAEPVKEYIRKLKNENLANKPR